MTSVTYRKAGRGGAGNFHSAADLKAADKVTNEDVEAQPNTNATNDLTLAERSQTEYAHLGRGGAGNWHKPAEVPQESAGRKASLTPKPMGSSKPIYSGRGGAGNFQSTTETTEQEVKEVELERIAQKEEVIRDVEQGLRSPQKAHLVAERLTRE